LYEIFCPAEAIKCITSLIRAKRVPILINSADIPQNHLYLADIKENKKLKKMCEIKKGKGECVY
jgi:hypothetical protein